MADLIDRQAALEAFDWADADVCEADEYGSEWGFGRKNIKDVLNKLSTIDPSTLRPKGEWISVEDRLPDLIPCNAGTAYSEAVIIWTTGRKAMVAVFDGDDFVCASDFWDADGEEATHWMPLPEPPDMRGEEWHNLE